MYGGDGKSTFALPNLQGSVPNCAGQGQGLSNYDQGQEGGSPTVTLLQTEIPAHNHFFSATTNVGTTVTSAQNQPGLGAEGHKTEFVQRQHLQHQRGERDPAAVPVRDQHYGWRVCRTKICSPS